MVDGLLQWWTDCVEMADGMLQDTGGHSVAILTSEWTTVNSATPKYGSYHMCCNKPTGTGGVFNPGVSGGLAGLPGTKKTKRTKESSGVQSLQD